MQSADWVPMRWPGGADWHKPETLAILERSPINCLVISAKEPPPGPLISGARRRGISLVTVDGQLPGLPALQATPVEEISRQTSEVVALTGTVWPGAKTGQHGEVEAGPTGPPWVDSNGWKCQLARAKAPGKPVWVLADPPEKTVVRTPSYLVACADAAAFGGRWVVSLDAETAQALAARNSDAAETWSTLTGALRFFEERRAWSMYPTFARFGVLSDFAGPNEFIAQEILNLAPRRALSCRIIDLASARRASFDGLKGVIWVDEKSPQGTLLELLMDFVARGGLLIVPSSSAPLADKFAPGRKHRTGYTVFASGSGQIAVAPEPWADPYVTTADAHLLLSHRHDVFRVFNSGAMNVHCTAGDKGQVVLHVVNYTGRTTYNLVSLYLAGRHMAARWSALPGTVDQKLSIARAPEGTEVHLPPFAAYAAVEFGGQA